MKKLYEQPVAEFIELDAADIIRTSGLTQTSIDGYDTVGAVKSAVQYSGIKNELN